MQKYLLDIAPPGKQNPNIDSTVMKTTLLLTAALCCLPALGQQPAEPQQPQSHPVSAAQSIINQMQATTNALVDVLQGVSDKAGADAAAREVGELVVQLKLLNDLAGYAPDYAAQIESMRMAQVNALMPMLMNTNPCYGSEAMLKALAPVVTIRSAQQLETAQPVQQPQPQADAQPQPQPQPEVQPQPEAQQPAPAEDTQPEESPAQQLADAILDGYKELTTILKGVQDQDSADAAAPYAAQVIAGILPLYDEAEETEGLADAVGVQIAQTQEISDLADLIENLLQAEPALYGSQALSNALALIVTIEEETEDEEAEQQQDEQPQEQEEPAPAAMPRPAQQTLPASYFPQGPDGEDAAEDEGEHELTPAEILAPAPQA